MKNWKSNQYRKFIFWKSLYIHKWIWYRRSNNSKILPEVHDSGHSWRTFEHPVGSASFYFFSKRVPRNELFKTFIFSRNEYLETSFFKTFNFSRNEYLETSFLKHLIFLETSISKRASDSIDFFSKLHSYAHPKPIRIN